MESIYPNVNQSAIGRWISYILDYQQGFRSSLTLSRGTQIQEASKWYTFVNARMFVSSITAYIRTFDD
jgi:hypothetical protein